MNRLKVIKLVQSPLLSMTYAKVSLEQSLGMIPPFDQLPVTALESLG